MNEGGDRFLVTFKNFKKNDHEKYLVHTIESQTFYIKNTLEKLNDIFEFYKNQLVVCNSVLILDKIRINKNFSRSFRFIVWYCQFLVLVYSSKITYILKPELDNF